LYNSREKAAAATTIIKVLKYVCRQFVKNGYLLLLMKQLQKHGRVFSVALQIKR